MSNQAVVNGIREGIVDLSIAAIHKNDSVDEIAHYIYNLYQGNQIMPHMFKNLRRLFPTYLEYQHPSAFSNEASVAMSGILFGMIILETLPINTEATHYMMSKDLDSFRDEQHLLDIGISCLQEIDFTPESIPCISLVKSEETEQILWSGFGLVVSNSLEVHRHEQNHAQF